MHNLRPCHNNGGGGGGGDGIYIHIIFENSEVCCHHTILFTVRFASLYEGTGSLVCLRSYEWARNDDVSPTNPDKNVLLPRYPLALFRHPIIEKTTLAHTHPPTLQHTPTPTHNDFQGKPFFPRPRSNHNCS